MRYGFRPSPAIAGNPPSSPSFSDEPNPLRYFSFRISQIATDMTTSYFILNEEGF